MAKQHLPNAVCGVLDYAAYPVGMLLVAPVILRYLGVERYGVWAVATAAISAGSILASGFGDANIQQIASDRGAGDSSRLLQTVRSTMGIHVVLGLCIGLIGWMLSPYVARQVAAHDAALETDCLWSLRIASVVMLVRAIESVCISTQRAFERYGPAVYVSIAGRLLSLALAAVLACISRSVAGILAASLVVIVGSVWMQLGKLRLLLGAVSHRAAVRSRFVSSAVSLRNLQLAAGAGGHHCGAGGSVGCRRRSWRYGGGFVRVMRADCAAALRTDLFGIAFSFPPSCRAPGYIVRRDAEKGCWSRIPGKSGHDCCGHRASSGPGHAGHSSSGRR